MVIGNRISVARIIQLLTSDLMARSFIFIYSANYTFPRWIFHYIELYTHYIIYLTQFFKLGIVGIWGWVIPCCGGCPVHCRMFGSSIPGLHPLDARSTHQLWCQKCLQDMCCRMFPGGQNHPQVKTTGWTPCPSLLPFPVSQLIISSNYTKFLILSYRSNV